MELKIRSKPSVIDLEYDPIPYVHPDDCYLPPISQCNIIDSGLSALNLIRLSAPLDGNCFFSALATGLRNLWPNQYGAITAKECRKRVADAFCLDMFAMDHAAFAVVRVLMGIQSNSCFFRNWATMAKYDPIALKERKIDVTILTSAVEYARKLGKNGEWSDEHVVCPIAASVWKVELVMHCLLGCPPELTHVSYYPWNNSKQINLPKINIVYHSHHFEPAVPFKPGLITSLVIQQLTSSSSASSTTTSLSSVNKTQSVRTAHILGDPYVGPILSFTLYAFNREKLCFDNGAFKLASTSPWLSNIPVRYIDTEKLYISKEFVYTVRIREELSEQTVWFLYAYRESDQGNFDDNNLLGIAIGQNRDVSFVLETDTRWIFAVNHPSNTISQEVVKKCLSLLRV